jgi:simple sugar transport system ATP-binding protein
LDEPLLYMENVSKTFGAVQALRRVNLTLGRGEVLGLVGDNAAGKSTLMKILTGAYTLDQGRILFDGAEVHFRTPEDSRRTGIEMIYQDFALAGNLDVAANVFLGREPTRRFLGVYPRLDNSRMRAEALMILNRLRIDISSVKLRVDHLSGGQQQSVAIARALAFNAKVVIMDEPTASLSVSAIEKLLGLIRELKVHGVSVIIISHRLQDVFAVGDRVMVLKGGCNVGSRRVAETSIEEVVRLMVSGEPVAGDEACGEAS